MNLPIKYAVKLFGVLTFIGLGLITLWIWVFAFFNGGSVIVTINTLGEMVIEQILMWTLLPVALVGALLQAKELVQK